MSTLDDLVAAHPTIFRGKSPEIASDVPAGWSKVVDLLFTDIEAALGPEACATLKVEQVKEKYGALRVYFRLGRVADTGLFSWTPTTM